MIPPLAFAQTDGILLVLLNHTSMRGPSVARMRDFFFYRGGILFSHTPERAKNIEDKVFFTTLMSQEGDVENEMPLCEGQENSEV